MIKKLHLLAMMGLFVTGLGAARNSLENAEFMQLENAINAHDSVKVKNLVRNVEQGKLNALGKQKVYEALRKTSQAALNKSKSQMFTNWRDAWKTVLGTVLVSYFGIYSYINAEKLGTEGTNKFRENIKKGAYKGTFMQQFIWGFSKYNSKQWEAHRKDSIEKIRRSSLINCAIGLIPLYLGLKCSNQKALIEQAEEIDHFINNALEQLENPDLDSKKDAGTDNKKQAGIDSKKDAVTSLDDEDIEL